MKQYKGLKKIVEQILSLAGTGRTTETVKAAHDAAVAAAAASAANATQIASLAQQKANKTQGDWIAPTLLNGWLNYNVDYAQAGYFKDDFGFVHLRGMLKDGTINQSIFMLPEGYRPSKILYVATTTNNSYAQAIVQPDGVVKVNIGNNTFVSLSNICFRV